MLFGEFTFETNSTLVARYIFDQLGYSYNEEILSGERSEFRVWPSKPLSIEQLSSLDKVITEAVLAFNEVQKLINEL